MVLGLFWILAGSGFNLLDDIDLSTILNQPGWFLVAIGFGILLPRPDRCLHVRTWWGSRALDWCCDYVGDVVYWCAAQIRWAVTLHKYRTVAARADLVIRLYDRLEDGLDGNLWMVWNRVAATQSTGPAQTLHQTMVGFLAALSRIGLADDNEYVYTRHTIYLHQCDQTSPAPIIRGDAERMQAAQRASGVQATWSEPLMGLPADAVRVFAANLLARYPTAVGVTWAWWQGLPADKKALPAYRTVWEVLVAASSVPTPAGEVLW